MPTYTNYKYRHWCQKCNDWKIFDEENTFKEDKKLTCSECGTEHQKTLLSDIPEDKLLEQRLRYKAQQKKDLNDIYSEFLMGGYNRNPLAELFMETPSSFNTRIVEADAGQKYIDEEKRRIEAEERMKRYEERQKLLIWKAQYKNVNRNDVCICGSGKKYKKCCLIEVEKVK